jgi:YidC/Oxa1 family membrane protein insertase
MDRSSVIVLVICAFLFVLWMQLTPRPQPPQRPGAGPTNTAAADSTNAKTALENAVSPATATPSVSPMAAAGPEKVLVLSNEYARYTFTSHGGGLKQAELLKYPESVHCGRHQPKGQQEHKLAALNAGAHQPVLALLGAESLVGNGEYQISRVPATGSNAVWGDVVRMEKKLPGGFNIVKEFQPTSNYLLRIRTRLENTTGQALVVPAREWVAGTSTPLHPQDDEALVGVHWHDGAGSSGSKVGPGYFDNKTLGCFPGTPRPRYHMTSPVAWSAAHNQFFFLGLVPQLPASEISATRFTLPPPGQEEIAANGQTRTNQFAIEVHLHYGATNLAPGQALEQEFVLYAGPKELRTLERVSTDLNQRLDHVMGWGWFGFFSQILLRSMNGLNALGLSYGWSVVAITVIVKMLFWPLTAVSTRASKRMQKLQPQMKALQEKFKDDPVKMQKKLMEFMRENKVSPMSGCWPVLLQFPVLIGFFQMVQSAIELRGASFLWACDLSKPDTVWVLPGLHLNVNPLPLLMGATMFWQASLMPPSPGMDPAQQKIMKYFPMIFLFILYNYSSGLTLYWTVQNLLSIAQMKLTKNTQDTPATPAAPAAPVARPPAKKRK